VFSGIRLAILLALEAVLKRLIKGGRNRLTLQRRYDLDAVYFPAIVAFEKVHTILIHTNMRQTVLFLDKFYDTFHMFLLAYRGFTSSRYRKKSSRVTGMLS
jgi:hypothetical protein